MHDREAQLGSAKFGSLFSKCMLLWQVSVGKPIWQRHNWDAYLANASLGSLFGKCMTGKLLRQVPHGEAYFTSACLRRLSGKCIIGKAVQQVHGAYSASAVLGRLFGK